MLDEPLGSLDRGLREHLLLELKSVLDRLDIPAIYVTHDQFEAFAIADRLAVMRAGRFVRVGAPQDVYRDPRTEFVARFLGFENIVDGTSDGETVRTAVGAWCVPAPAGPVRLLLRGDGVEVVPAATDQPSTVTGTLATVAFQGLMVQVQVAVGGSTLSFTIPGSTALPSPGEQVTLRVPSAQVLAGE
jgi:ABC-type Fe3+/spermidine/putrescine transport system ATPase subunit